MFFSNKEPFLYNCFGGGKKITFETLALSRLSQRPLPKRDAPPLATCTWCSCCPSLVLGSSRSSWQPLAAGPNAESWGGAGDMSAAWVGAAPMHGLLKTGGPRESHMLLQLSVELIWRSSVIMFVSKRRVVQVKS